MTARRSRTLALTNDHNKNPYMSGMLIRTGDERWHEPATTAFDNEEALKSLVREIPTLLSESMAFVDEFYIPGVGSVDLLGVGTDGTVTLVECKLRKNPEIRREVVGQVLAYAGGLWRTTYDDFAARYAGRAGMPLVDHLQANAGDEVPDPDLLRSNLHQTLQSGAFKLVIAVDEITKELQLVIEYLNVHTAQGVQVIGLEVDYARHDNIEVLVPRTYGESSAATKVPAGQSKLSEADFAKVIATLQDDDRAVLNLLLHHGRTRGHHFAPGSVGMSCWYDIDGVPTSTWAIWPKEANPSVSISIGSLAVKAPIDRVLRFVERLKAHSSLAPHLKTVDESHLNKFPTIPVKGGLAHAGAADELLAAIDELIRSDA